MGDRSINADMIRGHIDTIILRVIDEQDSYGYEIIKSVATYSDGRYELKEPSLYTSLKRLEGQGLISSYWGDESQGGRRKYYAITAAGREVYEANVSEWEQARELIDLLIKRS